MGRTYQLTDYFVSRRPHCAQRTNFHDSKIPGFVLAVRPRRQDRAQPKKTFLYRYRSPKTKMVLTITLGHWTPVERCVGFLTAEQARAEALRLERLVRSGQDPRDPQPVRVGTLAALAEEFLAIPRAAATVRNYKMFMRVALEHLGGGRSPDEITVDDIRNLVVAIGDDPPVGLGKTPMAIAVKRCVSSLYSWAIARGKCKNNPAASLKSRGFGWKVTKRDRTLLDHELPVLWHALCADDQITSAVLRWMLLTGVRQRTARLMEWSQLETYPDGSLYWQVPKELNKNALPHWILVTELGQQLLEYLRPISGGAGNVFPSPRGGALVSITRARDRVSAELKIRPWRPHDLRRSVAKGLENLGIERNTIKLVLNHGHADATSHYLHPHGPSPSADHARRLWDKHLQKLIARQVHTAPREVIPFAPPQRS